MNLWRGMLGAMSDGGPAEGGGADGGGGDGGAADGGGWTGLDEALGYGARLLLGERVRLRASTDDDLPLLDAWWNDTQVALLNQRAIRPRTPGAHHDRFRGWYANDDLRATGFSVVTRDDELFVGHVSLFDGDAKDRSATFGIVLGPEHWSKGLGTEATQLMVRYGFLELGLHRIQLNVWAYNERAVAAYTTAGFVVEGRHREVSFHAGRWHDELTMAQLARDWRQANPSPLP
jgi:RimJ/RimL family protein N-acetyltransferase